VPATWGRETRLDWRGGELPSLPCSVYAKFFRLSEEGKPGSSPPRQSIAGLILSADHESGARKSIDSNEDQVIVPPLLAIGAL
jgi:hypothetical protein